jgi:hypothetical protein
MNKYLRVVIGVAALLALEGCAATTPRWDAAFGNTLKSTLASQVARPEAARAAETAPGVDGAAARASYERYLKAAANPPSAAEPMTVGGNSK